MDILLELNKKHGKIIIIVIHDISIAAVANADLHVNDILRIADKRLHHSWYSGL